MSIFPEKSSFFTLLARADGKVQLFATIDGKPLGPILQSSPEDRQGSLWNDFGINDLAFSPNDKHLAVVDQDNAVRLWDIATGGLQFARGHRNLSGRSIPSVRKVCFSPDERLIATAAIDGSGQVLDANTGEVPPAWEIPDFLGPDSSIEFSKDGHKLVASTKRGVAWWDVKTAHEIAENEGNAKNARFSGDGTRLIEAFDDGSVHIVDASTGNELGNPIKGFGSAFDADFAPDGSRIMAAWTDGSVRHRRSTCDHKSSG